MEMSTRRFLIIRDCIHVISDVFFEQEGNSKMRINMHLENTDAFVFRTLDIKFIAQRVGLCVNVF